MKMPFKFTKYASFAGLLFSAAYSTATADTISLTGTLATPEDQFSTTVTLVSTGTITLQTYGFGGGTNGAGASIPSGGFDPFVGLFSGTGPAAVFLNGDSDILSNYTPGCPPASTVTIGSIGGQCGDVNLSFPGLTPGDYTVLLTDGEYLPNAVFEAPGGTLGDGFTDFTAGAFQTCVDQNNCNSDTANWALDITAPAGSPVPEPGSATLCLTTMALAIIARTRPFFKQPGDSK